ncbi:MAG: hypothetical protein Q9220_004353 [cf. Caloplaca sp. 1 TL-2023]
MQGAVNVASDFYIFLLPIPGVLQLQLPKKRKIGVCAIFATGSLVVELTVGVMCGCMPALAGFFRHYLPLLRSIGSFFSSRARGFSFLKIYSRPSSSGSSSKRLATRDIKVTLGSRIDGQGHFLNPTSVFAREEDWLKLGEAAHYPPSLSRKSSATRREWHEGMAELKRQSLSSHPPSATKSCFQTRSRNLSIHDEEAGVLSPGIYVREGQDQHAHLHDRNGYF